MIPDIDYDHYGYLMLKALGVFFVVISWYPVVFGRTVTWKGSRAAMSTPSKLVFAVG